LYIENWRRRKMTKSAKERMLEEDRERARALWVNMLLATGMTKEEAERDFEKKHPLPKKLKKEER